MTRVEKLEAAVRAATKLRRAMIDMDPLLTKLWVTREAVEAYDNTILGLKDDVVSVQEKAK